MDLTDILTREGTTVIRLMALAAMIVLLLPAMAVAIPIPEFYNTNPVHRQFYPTERNIDTHRESYSRSSSSNQFIPRIGHTHFPNPPARKHFTTRNGNNDAGMTSDLNGDSQFKFSSDISRIAEADYEDSAWQLNPQEDPLRTDYHRRRPGVIENTPLGLDFDAYDLADFDEDFEDPDIRYRDINGFASFADGSGDSIKRMLTAPAEIILHPDKFVQGLGALVMDPVGSAVAFGHSIRKTTRDRGLPYVLGSATTDVAALVAPISVGSAVSKGITTAGKVGSAAKRTVAASKLGRMSGFAGKGSGAVNAGKVGTMAQRGVTAAKWATAAQLAGQAVDVASQAASVGGFDEYQKDYRQFKKNGGIWPDIIEEYSYEIPKKRPRYENEPQFDGFVDKYSPNQVREADGKLPYLGAEEYFDPAIGLRHARQI